jgi:hypothetical protein
LEPDRCPIAATLLMWMSSLAPAEAAASASIVTASTLSRRSRASPAGDRSVAEA